MKCYNCNEELTSIKFTQSDVGTLLTILSMLNVREAAITSLKNRVEIYMKDNDMCIDGQSLYIDLKTLFTNEFLTEESDNKSFDLVRLISTSLIEYLQFCDDTTILNIEQLIAELHSNTERSTYVCNYAGQLQTDAEIFMFNSKTCNMALETVMKKLGKTHEDLKFGKTSHMWEKEHKIVIRESDIVHLLYVMLSSPSQEVRDSVTSDLFTLSTPAMPSRAMDCFGVVHRVPMFIVIKAIKSHTSEPVNSRSTNYMMAMLKEIVELN